MGPSIEVSVIVPMFNAAGSLDDCLDALLRQDVPAGSYEVIVVDNGSTDDSMAIARRHPTVRLLSEPRPGSYAARNRGLQAATGELIAFTDADCIPRPDWLRHLKESLSEPEALVVMGRARPGGTSAAVRLLGGYDHHREIAVMSSDDASAYYAHTNCLMTRRRVLDEVGPFDERPRGADTIFVQRVLERHGVNAVRYQPGAVVVHTEIRSAIDYLRKAVIYGRSARGYSRIVRTRPLRNGERFRIYRDVVRGDRLSWPESAYLFGLLLLGVAAYGLGRLSPQSAADRLEASRRT